MIEGEELASDLLDWRIGIDLDGLREDGGGSRQLRRWVVQELQGMYAQRYEVPRNTLPRGPSYLSHVLHALKNSRADHFRQALRVTPLTFDALVAAIEDDPIFHNHSGNGQLPVEEQLAILLYRFGHDGNAAGLQGIANWAGVGKGTVVLVTRRVMTAILRPEFMKKAVRMPTPEEKEDAKRWVQQHSCRAWRNGWSFVDGTLVPLSNRPAWFGESYYDRKNHYSLNFQVVSLPNLRIIDYSFGYPGSRHDSVAWKATQLYLEHETLLEDDEWVWADSAYPVCLLLFLVIYARSEALHLP
ncbi:hypothetical protein BDN72DRAFT_933980 [Pluteus cervinus]|uniref:Uncharacterized protein n=1 Tax=Pluteus cervinus TaxID=181527 RepID=A0ACD3A7Z2_9AGAR|nr:hypothetical protein BDN72DRAFT_933980 [Pluteus cervinus]